MWRLFAGFLLVWKQIWTIVEGELFDLNYFSCLNIAAQVNKYTWVLMNSSRIIAASPLQHIITHPAVMFFYVGSVHLWLSLYHFI